MPDDVVVQIPPPALDGDGARGAGGGGLLSQARLAADARPAVAVRLELHPVVVDLDAVEPAHLARHLDLLGDEDARERVAQDGPEDGHAAGHHGQVDLDGGEDDADGAVPHGVEGRHRRGAVLDDGYESDYRDGVDAGTVLDMKHVLFGSKRPNCRDAYAIPMPKSASRPSRDLSGTLGRKYRGTGIASTTRSRNTLTDEWLS